MAGSRLYRMWLLIGVISVQVLSQKILSSKKKCADPQCESLMMRVSAKQDFAGPDCRFLSFRAGEEINVYYKLAEGREDLWQGSKGKAYGFFPREMVNVEEVYLSEEVDVPAQEIDFVCLDGGEYFFENEDSVLHKYRQSEEEFWDHPGTEHGEKKPPQGDLSAADSQEDVPSGIAGWFGMGKSPDKPDSAAKTEPLDEEVLLSEQMPENNVAQDKEPEIPQADKPGWFGGGLQRLLPFGGKNPKGEAEASSSTSQSASEELVVETEKENTSSDPREAEQENRESKNIEQAKPKWFNFAIKDVLGFGGKNDKREEPSESVDETGSPTPSNSPESNTEHKTETSVVDQPTMEDANHDEDSNLEPTTVFSELDTSQSDQSKVGDTEVNFDVPELIRTPEKEKDITLQEDPEVPPSVNANHGSTRWLKSVVSNVMNLGTSGGDQETTEGANIKETNHEVGLSDGNPALNSISGEPEPSREPDADPKSEEAPGGCGSGERSADGYCRAQQAEGRPPRSVPSAEELCDVIIKKTTSTYLDLPSAAEMTVFLKRAWSQSRALCDDIIGPARFALSGSIRKVVSLLPEDLRPSPDFHGISWDVLIVTVLVGCLSILLFAWRILRCIKSRSYAGRELKLGEKVTEILNSKSDVLEKLSEVQKEYDEVARSLQGSGHQRLLEEIAEHKALQETLQSSNRELEENISKLEQDLEEEKRRGSELDNTLSDLNEKIKALEESFKNEKSSKDEIRTTQKVFEINKERLESSLRDAVEEQAHLRESVKQLSKEAEGWEERFNELSENSRMLSSSVQSMQEDLSSRQSQVKTLIDSLLKLKDWSSEVEETSNDQDEDGVLDSIKWDFENGEPLGAPQKRTIKKLIFAAMLNASLKSTESEKKQLSENLSDEMKAKEHFSERISNLQNTNQSLSAEKKQLEEEAELLKQKMSVMMEVYQENEQKLHRKLTVQEKERLQKEAKLTKADEKVSMTTSELANVRTRLTELEEETERTVISYQSQVSSYEKKSHDNWVAARAAERYLSDVKRETLTLRQKLTEAEYKVELLEKDPFALDVIHAIGRENSPYGLSPINRVADNRAFLSPPPLLEGPLRLSPMLPAGERGMRPPGYYPGYPGPKERSDVNADRKSDHQRTLSDAGSLSPPWDREQKSNNVPPPGLPYPDHHFPPRRPDRYYHYPPPSGRFSGPAELTRNQGRPFMDSLDGRSSSPDYKSRSNTSRDMPEEANNVPGAPTMEGESMDGGTPEYPMHPPPSMRVPLLPLDPRAPFFRRPFPMPPPPMDMYGPPGYPALPPPHMTMRSPLPPQRYPSYPMHPEAFYPPQHIQPPPRDDHPPETQHVPPPPSADSSHNLPETQT